MRIIVQKGVRESTNDVIRHTLLTAWCRYGCPERMRVHIRSTGKTYNLLEGSLTSKSGQILFNKINKLQPGQNATKVIGRQSATRSTRKCLFCGGIFISDRKDRKFCCSSHRALYSRRKREEEVA